MVAMAAHVLAVCIPVFTLQLAKDVAALGDWAHVMLKVPRCRHAKRAAQSVWGPARHPQGSRGMHAQMPAQLSHMH